MRHTPLFVAILSFPGTFLPAGLKLPVRRLARRALFLLLRFRSRPFAPDAAVTLVIAPHQDDATLGCGGLIFQKRLAGHPVHVVYLTDGSASHPGHPTLTPAALAALRMSEARLAKFRLGVDSACLSFLALPDGKLDSLGAEEKRDGLARLAALIAEIRPALVLLPFRRDGSSEHTAAFHLTREALARAGLRPRLLEYPVWAAWSPLLLAAPLLTASRVHRYAFPGYGPRKAFALSAYVSQFQPTPPWTRAVLPPDFERAFSPEEEFFFEMRP